MIRKSITTRLFLVILAATIIAVLSMGLLMRWSMDRIFIRHMNNVATAGISKLQKETIDFYLQEKSWQKLLNNQRLWNRIVLHAINPEEKDFPTLSRLRKIERSEEPPPADMGDGPPKPINMRMLTEHFTLLDQQQKLIVGRHGPREIKQRLPLLHEGKTIGYLGFVPTKALLNEKQLRLLKELQTTFGLLAVIIIALATLFTLLLARKLVQPVKRLAGATHQLAAGNFSTRVVVNSRDEIGQLAGDFNHLAFTLEKNEQARRQWMADISHELRTPVAILRGELEALQDGVRPLNQEAVSSLHGEAVQLTRLADDLYQLAMSEVGALTYQKENLDLLALLTELYYNYRGKFNGKGIKLSLDSGECDELIFFGDDSRLRQLFGNLFDNALKYTDGGGQLQVRVAQHKNLARIDFLDSAPSVPEKELQRLLDRFYRSQRRDKNSCGAGLGLNICRNIVEGHQGYLSVTVSPLGGLWVSIELPLREYPS